MNHRFQGPERINKAISFIWTQRFRSGGNATTQQYIRKLLLFFQLFLCYYYNQIKLSFRIISTFLLAGTRLFYANSRWIRQSRGPIWNSNCEFSERKREQKRRRWKCKWHNYWMHANSRQFPACYEVCYTRRECTFLWMNISCVWGIQMLLAQNEMKKAAEKREKTQTHGISIILFMSWMETVECSGHRCSFICNGATDMHNGIQYAISSQNMIKMRWIQIISISLVSCVFFHTFESCSLLVLSDAVRNMCSRDCKENFSCVRFHLFSALYRVWFVYTRVCHFLCVIRTSLSWLPNGTKVLFPVCRIHPDIHSVIPPSRIKINNNFSDSNMHSFTDAQSSSN